MARWVVCGDALAAVTAVAGVSAQNVTLYGRMDMGTSNIKTTSNTSETKTKSLFGDQGGQGGMRLGVRGSEDLGGGLTASFNYEMALNAEGAATGSVRTSTIGLSGGFGGVTIGTFLNGNNTVRGFTASIDAVPGGAFLGKHVNAAGDMSTAQVHARFGGNTTLKMSDLLARVGAANTGGDFVITQTAGDKNRIVLTAAQAALLAIQDFSASASYGGADFAGVATDTSSTAVATALFGSAKTALTAAETAAIVQTLGSLKAANDAITATNVARADTLRSLLRNGAGARSQNSIAYTTPSFNGLTIGVGMFDESAVATASGAKGNEVKGSGQSLALGYSSGPLRAGLAYSKAKTSSNTASVAAGVHTAAVSAVGESSAKTEGTLMAVSYNLGFAQPYVQYETTEGKLTQFRGDAVNGTGVKTAAYEIGSKFPMGAFTPFVLFGKGDIKTTAGGAQTSKTDTSAFQIGTTYAMSKRTSVYAGTGNIKQKDTVANTQTKTSGYKVGLVHTF